MTYDLRPAVIVVGGCNVDVIARPFHPIEPGVSNPGTVYVGAGGAGRNIAVNLARLGAATQLISAVGHDPAGDQLIDETARAGVGIGGVVRFRDRSNYYVAIADTPTDLRAVSDMAAAEALTPDQVRAAMESVPRPQMVVVDANLRADTLAAVLDAAGPAPICLVPTSPAKAPRIAGALTRASLVTTGAAELAVLIDRPIASSTDALDAASRLHARSGADVVVSMGSAGVGIAAADTLWLETLPVTVVDVIGAGDAVAAAAVYGRLTGMSDTEMLRLARAAGAMTVTIQGATHPALSLSALRTYA